MNYQRNNMRHSGAQPLCGSDCGQNSVRQDGGNRPLGGGCGCDRGNGGREGDGRGFDCLHGMSLAMVYSPCQEFEDLYDHTEGLRHGTIFRALDKPFSGKGGRCNG